MTNEICFPGQEGTGSVTPTPATAAPKPVIELDLSSPQNDVPESPLIFKQVIVNFPFWATSFL